MFVIGRTSFNDQVLDWKKEDFKKAYGSAKDEKGNLKYNADEIYKSVQAYKKDLKAKK